MASFWELRAPTRIGTTFTAWLSNQHGKRENVRIYRDQSVIPTGMLNGCKHMNKEFTPGKL